MFRRSESDPDEGGAGWRAASSSPPLLVDAGFVPSVDAGAAFATATTASAFSAASFVRRAAASAAAASSSSSTGGACSLHSPSRSAQLPSPFSSMLIRPSASSPSAALPID